MPGRGGQRYDRSDSEPPVQGFQCYGRRQFRHDGLQTCCPVGAGGSGRGGETGWRSVHR